MRSAAAGAAAAALALAGPAGAAEFNNTSVSALYGTGFDDVSSGMATPSERLFTLTFENTLGWKYGDSFFFADLASGRFALDEGTGYAIYAEWQPRLSLGKIAGAEIAAGPFHDLLIAAEINRGPGFSALLGGLGTNLVVPGFAFWTLNVYLRDTNFNEPSYQVTSAWSLPFRLAGLGLSFDGFFDLYGTDARAVNLLTQPQLLVDFGVFAGLDERQLQLGSEVWIHLTRDFAGEDYETVAPQVLAKLRF